MMMPNGFARWRLPRETDHSARTQPACAGKDWPLPSGGNSAALSSLTSGYESDRVDTSSMEARDLPGKLRALCELRALVLTLPHQLRH